jgi:hypothetical protein
LQGGSNAFEVDRRACLEAGMNDCVAMPSMTVRPFDPCRPATHVRSNMAVMSPPISAIRADLTR